MTFKAAPNFESPASSNTYTVTLDATDAGSRKSTQAMTIAVTNVNEAPTASGAISAQTAVNVQSAWSLDLSSYFVDVGAGDTHSYALTAGTLPAGLTLNSATGVISGTPTADSAASTYTVTMTDSGGLTAT